MENQTESTSYSNLIPQVVPYSTATLVLGIISIPTCMCYGFVGLVTGIIGIVLGNKARNIYKANPSAYTETSYKNAHAGFICSIIGTSLSGMIFLTATLYLIIAGIAVGSIFSHLPWDTFFH